MAQKRKRSERALIQQRTGHLRSSGREHRPYLRQTGSPGTQGCLSLRLSMDTTRWSGDGGCPAGGNRAIKDGLIGSLGRGGLAGKDDGGRISIVVTVTVMYGVR